MNNQSTMAGVDFLASSAVAYTASAASSGDFPAETAAVRLYATTDCFLTISLGTFAATASGNGNMFLPAGNIEYFIASQGQKVSVIQSTGAGTLYISPCK